MACYCGKGATFEMCCQPIHEDIYKAHTAEALMRARYSAYVVANIDFLMASHHSSTRPENEKIEILNWTKKVRWQYLEVLKTERGLQPDSTGIVEFIAYYKQGVSNKKIHEVSRFVQEGHWFYVEGEHA